MKPGDPKRSRASSGDRAAARAAMATRTQKATASPAARVGASPSMPLSRRLTAFRSPRDARTAVPAAPSLRASGGLSTCGTRGTPRAGVRSSRAACSPNPHGCSTCSVCSTLSGRLSNFTTGKPLRSPDR